MKPQEEGYYTGANDALYALQHDIPAHPQTVERLCELRAQDAGCQQEEMAAYQQAYQQGFDWMYQPSAK